jgi:hypothetical protein
MISSMSEFFFVFEDALLFASAGKHCRQLTTCGAEANINIE